MTYQHLKFFIILATVLVWLRLIAGTTQFLITTMPSMWNSPATVAEQKN
ncbi:MAG: hypothetical protein AB4426_21510 [Xenococcaceae cyanobacterium]